MDRTLVIKYLCYASTGLLILSLLCDIRGRVYQSVGRAASLIRYHFLAISKTMHISKFFH